MFENTILAILKVSPGLGSIQIRKAVCIADAVHFSLHGQGITGARYIKEKLGPVPDDEGFRCLNEMIISGKIEINEEPVGPYTQNSFYAATAPDYSVFNRSQIEIINYAARIALSHTGTVLSFMTHDAVYSSIKMREEIPLEAICTPVVTGYDTEPFTEEERRDIRKFFESDENRLFAFG
jgi:hypothetical protein